MFNSIRWAIGFRNRDIEARQDRALAQQAGEDALGPNDSSVERHEAMDQRAQRKRSLHPILRAFGPTLVIEKPRTLVGLGGEHIGQCQINGLPVVFTYFVPQYRVVIDRLDSGVSEAEAQAREQWCGAHQLTYYYAFPGQLFDFEEIARHHDVPLPEEQTHG